MFYKISKWALMLTAVSSVLASPIAPSNSTRSAEADVVGSCSIPCPPGNICIQVVCGGDYCPLPDCANCPDCYPPSKRSPETPLADRQFECPPGVACSPPIECNKDTCDFPDCADAEVCQNQDQKRSLEDRQFGCPPGVPCGHGPVCTPQLRDLPGCADADVCRNNNNNEDRKRNAETDLADRNCDICREGDDGVLVCGCECTADLCDDPSCAGSDVCQGSKRLRRSAQSEMSYDCSDHPTMCACAID